MITGQLRSQINKLWDEFWTGGISNPLTVIEQITFLMFIRMLDLTETRRQKQAERGKKKFESSFRPDQQHLRWQNLMKLGGEQLLKTVRDEVFPHLRELAGTDSTFGKYMQDATFMIQKATLLVRSMEMINDLPLEKSDTKGDLYEYLLSKLNTAGINGQFRTPRHIIRLMVDMLKPKPTDIVGDPACGTAGFLVAVLDYLYEHFTSTDGVIEEVVDGEPNRIYTGDLLEPYRDHIQRKMFYGFDFDVTMLRLAAMNLMLHGVDNPDIAYQDTLSNRFAEQRPKLASDYFDIILANPPFKGSLDHSDVHSSLTAKVKTKKTELLFVALILRMLKLGGRCAMIVPAGVLEASTSHSESLRRYLVEEHQLEAIIALPHYVFKPYASVSTAILIFTKGGRTERVWAYDVEHDGLSGDGARSPVSETDLPDVREQWERIQAGIYEPKEGKHGWFNILNIRDNNYNLSPRAYLASRPGAAKYPYVAIQGLCTLVKGGVGAMQATPGDYPLVTTAQDLGSHSEFQFEGEAVCVPLVSSTGHGHASIKRLRYMSGKFSAATIVGVLQVRDPKVLSAKYLYRFLQAFKDDLLVPLMKGAANVSLSLGKIGSLRIPLPPLSEQLHLIHELDAIDTEMRDLTARLRSLQTREEVSERYFRERILEVPKSQSAKVRKPVET